MKPGIYPIEPGKSGASADAEPLDVGGVRVQLGNRQYIDIYPTKRGITLFTGGYGVRGQLAFLASGRNLAEVVAYNRNKSGTGRG